MAALPAATRHNASTTSATTAGRHTRIAPAPVDQTTAVADPVPVAAPTVDTGTGGVSAPSEEDGFGVGVDGLTPRTEQTTSQAVVAEPEAVPSTGDTGETGGGHATPADAVEGGGESSSVGTAGSAESASGSIPPG